jgi:hypothetical protein
MDSCYQSAIAMDEQIGWERAQRPVSETKTPVSPQGYSLGILLQLKVIDLMKELLRIIPASFSGTLPPPFPPEPRPQTAEQRFRDAIDTHNVNEALQAMGVDI